VAGSGGPCEIDESDVIEGEFSLCHIVTNVGDVDLAWAGVDMTVTFDGREFPLPPPGVGTTFLPAGETETVFQVVTGLGSSVLPCGPDEQQIPVEAEQAVEVSVTWTFDVGVRQIEADASDAFTQVGRGFQCLPLVGDPPTFTG
jgi:hypothetical protein